MKFHCNALACIERAGTINLPLYFFHEGLNYVNPVVSLVLSMLQVPRGDKSSESKPPIIHFGLHFFLTPIARLCVYFIMKQHT